MAIFRIIIRNFAGTKQYFIYNTFLFIITNGNKYQTLSQAFSDQWSLYLLDYHSIYHHRMVLSHHWTLGLDMYDWTGFDQHLARSLLVWTHLSARQYV